MQVEFLADTEVLRRRFEALVRQAREIEVAVAWAGKPATGVESLLWKAKKKVRKLVVGCTLHNTHPDFLKRWQRHPQFRVFPHTTEFFHPKVYLFRLGGEVSLLAGSSNLTAGGFEKNREANVLLRGSLAARPIADARAYIASLHRVAHLPRGETWRKWLAWYRSDWQKRQTMGMARPTKSTGGSRRVAEKSLQGLDGWSFEEYFGKLKVANARLEVWLRVLEKGREQLRRAGWTLQGMSKEGRRLIAGPPVPGGREPDIDRRCFGTMGSGHFLHAAINDPARIDRALQCIPREGPLEDAHWAAFREVYRRAFEKAATGSASRLLCFWRPDVFFSANHGSVPEIARRSRSSQASLREWDGYWNAVKWVRQLPWVCSDAPKAKLAQRCWLGRVALLDVLMYKP